GAGGGGRRPGDRAGSGDHGDGVPAAVRVPHPGAGRRRRGRAATPAPARVLPPVPDTVRRRADPGRRRPAADRALADRGVRPVAAAAGRRPGPRGDLLDQRRGSPRPAVQPGQGGRLDPALVRGQPRPVPARPATRAGRDRGGGMRTRIVRSREWAFPPPPVRREVLQAAPEVDEHRPPVLFVPGFGHGAWAFAEHWLERTAERGFPAYAMSLRGHGASGSAPKPGLRAY